MAVLIASLMLLSFLLRKQIRNSREPFEIQNEFNTRADIALKDLTIYQTQKGAVEWEIHAQSAEWFDQENRVAISRARAGMTARPGLEIRFAGDRGTVNTRSYDFTLANDQEDMKVEMSNGYTILTKALQWNNRDREIRSNDPVRIIGPDFSISGSGFLFKAPDEELSILRNVHVRFDR